MLNAFSLGDERSRSINLEVSSNEDKKIKLYTDLEFKFVNLKAQLSNVDIRDL